MSDETPAPEDEEPAVQPEPETPSDDAAAQAPAPDESGPPRCQECDAALESDQTYCLECGAPTPLAPRMRRRGGMGVLAAGLAVLGVGAGFLGFAVAGDDGGSTRTVNTGTLAGPGPVPPPTGATTIDTTGVGTGPLPPDTSGGTISTPTVDTGGSTGFVTTTSGTAPLPGDTSGSANTPTGTTDTTGGGETSDTTDTEATTDSADVTSDWPVGTSAWTAIVASAQDATAAQDQRTKARDAGYGANILLSDDHANLAPGLYVVYVGVFANRRDAVSMASKVRGTFPGAYARFVSS